MAHLRSQIFAAIKSRLAEIPEFSVSGKVERGRTAAIRTEDLPAITLTWADRAETSTIRPFSALDGSDGYDRSLPISIILHLRDTDPEEEFDRLCVLIEGSLGGVVTLGGLVIELTLSSQQFFVDRTTGLPLMAGSIIYVASYKTLASNPEQVAI